MVSEWNRKASQAMFANKPPENIANSREQWQQTVTMTKSFMDRLNATKKAMRAKRVIA